MLDIYSFQIFRVTQVKQLNSLPELLKQQFGISYEKVLTVFRFE